MSFIQTRLQLDIPGEHWSHPFPHHSDDDVIVLGVPRSDFVLSVWPGVAGILSSFVNGKLNTTKSLEAVPDEKATEILLSELIPLAPAEAVHFELALPSGKIIRSTTYRFDQDYALAFHSLRGLAESMVTTEPVRAIRYPV